MDMRTVDSGGFDGNVAKITVRDHIGQQEVDARAIVKLKHAESEALKARNRAGASPPIELGQLSGKLDGAGEHHGRADRTVSDADCDDVRIFPRSGDPSSGLSFDAEDADEDTDEDVDLTPRKEDRTPQFVVESRGTMTAIISALSSALGGVHVEMEITKKERDALPQLNPENDRQYKWIQYMVWRKWMMVTALCVSVIICGVTTGQILLQMEHLYDVVDRCESGDNNMILDTAEHQTGHSGKKIKRTDVLDKLMKPVGGTNVKSYRHKCAPPLSAETSAISSYAAGELLECDELAASSSLMVGECKWFPFIPWTKTPPDAPVKANSTTGSPTAMLNVGSNANFLGKISESGCGTDGEHKNMQYTQSQSCVCSHNLQVFTNYSWLNLGADALENIFVTGNESIPAEQRNLLRFADPMYCQSPERTYATACHGPGCVEYQEDSGDFTHPERCTVEVTNQIPSCVENPASCCTDDDAAVNGILLSNGWMSQALFDSGHVVTCSQIQEGSCEVPELAAVCGLACAQAGNDNDCMNAAPSRTTGILGHIGEFGVCYHSEDSANFDQEKYEDRFPALEARKCCSPSEYLFTGALWNEKKRLYEFFMLACQIIIALNNVLMAILGLCYWANWKMSRKFVFFAWIFPFVLKFIQLSVPAYEAQEVDASRVANMTIEYGLKQFG
jgi:hypothetical protein